MKLVRIEGYACGYYSDAEWNDQMYLTEESYEKVKDYVDDLDIYVYELDGKHSETQADIDVTIVDEKDFSRYSWEGQYDGYDIVETLQDNLSRAGIEIDLDEEKAKADEIIKNIDGSTTIEVTVKKSQVELVREFVSSLG